MTGQPGIGADDDGLTYPGQFPQRVPRQLPEASIWLFGRETELAALDNMLTAAPTGPSVAMISGPPGVGKTALAVNKESQVGASVWTTAVDHGFTIIFDLAMGGSFPNGRCGCTTPTSQPISGGTMSVRDLAVYQR